MINEKLKIRPADISNMSNVSASNEMNYIVWFFHTKSIWNFLKNANLCKDENVVVIDHYVELIVLSDDEFEKNSCYLTGTKYSLFCSSLNKEDLATYLKNEVTCGYLHDIEKHRKQDHNISVVNESVCFEKLKIRPVNVSDLQESKPNKTTIKMDYIDPNYNDMAVGYVAYVRGNDDPYVCINGKSANNIGISKVLDSCYYLLSCNLDSCNLTYLEMSDYEYSYPKCDDDISYDIVTIGVPSVLKEYFSSKSSFIEYYKQLPDKP